jgi:O-antigen/teichoic acid export membrane protein
MRKISLLSRFFSLILQTNMKKIAFKSLFPSEFVRNSSILLSGNVLGQGIVLLIYPILTRMYLKSDFGVFATFASVCSLLTIVGTGRYEESLMIAKNRKETVNLLGFSLKWLFVFSIALFIVLALFREPVLSLFKQDDIAVFWYYIPLTVFAGGLLSLLNNLALREKKFKTIAGSNVARNSVNSFSRLLSGALSFTGQGLALSNVLALIASIFSYSSLKKYIQLAIHGKWTDEKTAALQHKDFPIFNLSRNFISSLSINLPFLYLISTFGSDKLGLFSMAFLVINTPVSLFTNSLFSAFFENITSLVREEKPVLPLLKSYWKNLCIYLLPCFVLAFFIAMPFFSIVFGAPWKESGIYFQYLLPWMFMMLTTAPLHSIFIIFKKQHKTLWMEFFYLLLRWLVLYSSICLMNFQLGILLFASLGVVYAIIFLIWIYSTIRKYEIGIQIQNGL